MADQPSGKKLTAALLGIFLGGFGAHKFYLGYTTTGLIQLASSVCFGLGAVIGLIEGIMYLMKTDEEFDRIYVEGKKEWF